jgi:hypothetical protein
MPSKTPSSSEGSAALLEETLTPAETATHERVLRPLTKPTYDQTGGRERAVAEQGGRVTPPLEREEFDAMRAAMADLERLERYRRRAWSRQRRAFQRFMEISLLPSETGRAGCSNSGDQADVHENQGVLDGSS